MDSTRSELFFEADTHVLSNPYSDSTRNYSLAIIVISSLCFFDSVFNAFTSDGLSFYSSVLFMGTSLLGVGVGGLGFHATKTGTTYSATRYFIAAAAYAGVYSVNVGICSVLEVFSYLEAGYHTTIILIVSCFLACFILAASVICVFNVITAYNYRNVQQSIPATAVRASFNDKLGYSSLYPIRNPSIVQEIQLRNTQADLN